MRQARLRPLWGFGWVGWIALAVLAALLIALARGWDLNLAVVRFTWWACGESSDVWFWWFARVWTPLHLVCELPIFMIFGPLYLAIAVFIAPRDRRRTRPLAGIAAVVAASIVLEFFWIETTPFILGGSAWRVVAAATWASALNVALLWWLTRSWIVLGAALLALGLSILNAAVGSWDGTAAGLAWETGVRRQLAGVYHLMLSTALIGWAIDARLTPILADPCAGCGYDLRGLPEVSACPECGGAARA
ncbi:MAG: hypothetical protein IBJ11_09120 [Phycisphaerales bacterium]|nr:hypothetical protein [Phycisphaerales bacterium]